MSWLAASLLVLGVGLLAGFVWYERTRPDAKLVALVGTLAAFGALGRVAFAPFPNVKPTTDIVLISGFALGGAPGYVVGAVSALASNFFFGQGPWSPWQMSGWGLVGVSGALLAWVVRKRSGQTSIGRWPLAAICFVIGFLYTAFQDFGTWMTYSDHSLRQLFVYIGQGLGFDLIHAVGCFAFAAIFGPLFIRALERYRRRLRIDWHRSPTSPRGQPGTALPLALIVALSLGLGAALAGAAVHPNQAQAATTPLGYLTAAQNTDGGFPSTPGQPSSAMVSGWVILALSVEGKNPATTSNGGASAYTYLKATVGQDLGSVGSLERTILAIKAAGGNPRAFAGHNLVGRLIAHLATDGSFSDQTNLTAFAVMALRAAGATVERKTIDWLLAQQDADGGFNFGTAGASSDVDDTGAVLQALAARPLAGGSGRSGLLASGEWPKVTRAIKFIESAQNADGGFPSQAGQGSNAQSTAWGVQGLDAVGANAATVRRHGSPTPLGYLRQLTGADGQIDYAQGENYTPVWVTAQSMLALAGRSLPLSEPALALQSAPNTSSSSSGTGSTTSDSTPTSTGNQTSTAAGPSIGERERALRAAAAARICGVLLKQVVGEVVDALNGARQLLSGI